MKMGKNTFHDYVLVSGVYWAAVQGIALVPGIVIFFLHRGYGGG